MMKCWKEKIIGTLPTSLLTHSKSKKKKKESIELRIVTTQKGRRRGGGPGKQIWKQFLFAHSHKH